MDDRKHLDAIRAQIIWDRLLAVVEEQAQTLIRTAFSTTVFDYRVLFWPMTP